MWNLVVVTCSDSRWAKALRDELSILHQQKLLNSQHPCLVLDDPGNLGSGGATLNALLVTLERLSSIQGHPAVNTTLARSIRHNVKARALVSRAKKNVN